MTLCLTVVEPEGKTTSHMFSGDEVTIGRSSRNGLRIDPEKYQQVSRLHGVIKKNDTGDYVYEDLDSTHGSWFHSRRIRGTHVLFRGDSVMIGAEGPVVTINWPMGRVTGREQTYLKQRPRNAVGFPLCFSQGFLNRFKLYEKIAVGGFGEVWRGVPMDGTEAVAIKLLHPLLLDPEHLGERDRQSLVRRFAREARFQHLLSRAGVIGVVKVHEWGDDPDRDYLYIVMDIIEGTSLDRVIMGHHMMPQVQAARYLLRIAQAMRAAHGFQFEDEKGAHCVGVLHRDIKPNNILIERSTDLSWLVDFGIARIKEGGEMLTSANVTVGTQQFLPPETLRNNVYNSATDLWGFAVTLFISLSRGKFPYGGVTRTELVDAMREHRCLKIEELRNDLDPRLVESLNASLHPDPEKRVQGFDHWVRLLDDLT